MLDKGEDLTGFESGMKIVFAVVDVATLGMALGATGVLKVGVRLTAKEATLLLGKTVAIETASNIAGYSTGFMANEADLPAPLVIMLSILAGSLTGALGTKLAIKNGAEEGIIQGAKSAENVISDADRIKIDNWDYTPTDDVYSKYKNVFDNPKYYDQTTGKIQWPDVDGFKAETKGDAVISESTVFKRFGENSGEFLGNATDSFESRALAPHCEDAAVHYYQLTEDYVMTTGKAVPWFGSDGGAEQFVKYKPDGTKYTIKELEDAGILEDITDLVKGGEVKID